MVCFFLLNVSGLICCLKIAIAQIPEFSEELSTGMQIVLKESCDPEPTGSSLLDQAPKAPARWDDLACAFWFISIRKADWLYQ